jgi:DNA-binding CsgD family transcriptional regulator/DNA polymerase III delta prime subunit
MELLERQNFLDEFSQLVKDVSIGEGKTVLLSGEAGVGKTSLIKFFTDSLNSNTELLWSGCDDLFTPRPLGPLYDIAFQIKSDLIKMLVSEKNKASIFSVFLNYLQSTSNLKIIVIEDVHWADESTLDLIKFLGRRINKCKSLLIITYRDDELKTDHPLKLTLSSLQSNYLKRIRLFPLSEDAVNTLAKRYHKADKNLYSLTGGNPLLVSELLSNTHSGTPLTIKELMNFKLNRLSSETRLAVELISVIPGKVEKWLAQELINNFNLIDEAIEFGILMSEAYSFLFRHELSRMAVEESLSEVKRHKFNTQVLSVLIKQKNTDQLLARIIHHASKADDREAILKYAPRAAKQASLLGAHKMAAKHYLTALHYSDQLTVEEELTLLEGRSYECFLTGQVEEAINSSEAVLKILGQNPDPEREGEIYRRLSRILWYECKDQKGEESLNKAIEIFEKLPPSRKLAMAYSNKSQTYGIREETEPSIYWGEKALNLARKLNDTEIEVHALNNIGCAKMLVQDKSGESDLLRSLEISLQNDLYEHVARAYTNLASIYLQQRKLYSADKYFSIGLEYANEKDIYVFSLCMAGHYAKVKLHLGDWNESIELANSVLNNESVPPGNKVMPLNVVGLIRARRNDPGVLKLIDDSSKLAIQMGEIEKIVSVTSAKAEYFWLQNKLADFANELKSIFIRVKKSNNPWAIGEIAFWLWKAGVLTEISKIIAKPFLLQIKGDWKGAADEWKKLSCPYEEALALADGNEESKIKALAILESLGATATINLLKQQMRESGIKRIPKGPRESTKANPLGLTKRQIDVLKLMTRGLSNSEIASNLYISPKTVDHHISAILAKLNLHSRMEAAAFVQSNRILEK